MKIIQRIIYTGFAAVAIDSAAMPVFPAYSIYDRAPLQGPDFEWYAQVGREPIVLLSTTQPEPRPGYIWSPQHWEWNGREHAWVEGHWIRDDYAEQVAIYNYGVAPSQLAEGLPPPVIIIDRR